jgi:hypothetical protein
MAITEAAVPSVRDRPVTRRVASLPWRWIVPLLRLGLGAPYLLARHP